MKLWFKLFISSVLIVITAVNVTMTWMLSTNLSAMLANERDRFQYPCFKKEEQQKLNKEENRSLT